MTEVLELNWEQVDLTNQTIHFYQRQKIQARTLKISDELTAALDSKSRRKPLVFESYRKEPLNKTKLIKTVNEFKERKLFEKDWTPDDLRHSFAVNFLERGGSIKELQRILGHKTNQHTRALYSEATKKTEQNFIHPFA